MDDLINGWSKVIFSEKAATGALFIGMMTATADGLSWFLGYFTYHYFEVKDMELFHITGISGHSIKHLMAAVAPLIFLMALRKFSRLREKL